MTTIVEHLFYSLNLFLQFWSSYSTYNLILIKKLPLFYDRSIAQNSILSNRSPTCSQQPQHRPHQPYSKNISTFPRKLPPSLGPGACRLDMSEATGSTFTPFPLLASQVNWERHGRPLEFGYRHPPESSFLELLQEVLPCCKKRAPLSQGELMEREFLRQRRQWTASTTGLPFDLFSRWSNSVGMPSPTPQPVPEPLLAPVREVSETEVSATPSSAHTPRSPIVTKEAPAQARCRPLSLRLSRRSERRSSAPDALADEYSAGALSTDRPSDAEQNEPPTQSTSDQTRPIKSKKPHRNPMSKLANKARSQRAQSSDHHDDKAPRRHIIDLPMRLWKMLAQTFSRSETMEGRAVHIEMTPLPTRPSSPAHQEEELLGTVAVLSGTPGDSMRFRRLSRTPTGELLEQSFHVERNEMGEPH